MGICPLVFSTAERRSGACRCSAAAALTAERGSSSSKAIFKVCPACVGRVVGACSCRVDRSWSRSVRQPCRRGRHSSNRIPFLEFKRDSREYESCCEFIAVNAASFTPYVFVRLTLRTKVSFFGRLARALPFLIFPADVPRRRTCAYDVANVDFLNSGTSLVCCHSRSPTTSFPRHHPAECVMYIKRSMR